MQYGAAGPEEGTETETDLERGWVHWCDVYICIARDGWGGDLGSWVGLSVAGWSSRTWIPQGGVRS